MGGGSVIATHQSHVIDIQEQREFGGGGSNEVNVTRAERHVNGGHRATENGGN